jgi:transcriptional regulator GlxA family with amidase domain
MASTEDTKPDPGWLGDNDDNPVTAAARAAPGAGDNPVMTDPRTVTTVLFDGFEPLDVFGPLELFGQLPDQFRLVLAGPDGAPVRSAHGTPVVTEVSYETAPSPDIVLVPGGRGTRPLVKDPAFLAWLARWAGQAKLVTSVCTGSALLAAAGLLDGYRATSNKRAFAWAREQGPRTEWVARARWVEDRDRWTSSGVAAGMDMALALIARMHGRPLAREIAGRAELEWHEDDEWDPFAVEAGLVPAE